MENFLLAEVVGTQLNIAVLAADIAVSRETQRQDMSRPRSHMLVI